MADDRTAAEIAAAERKAAADADAARVDAERKQAELDEWRASAGSRRSEASATLEDLRLKNAAAERAAVKDLIPDLGPFDRGSLTVPDSSTLFQALLGSRAMESAAVKLVAVVKGDFGLGNDYRVLVTTNLDLASRDVTYTTVLTRLTDLTALVDHYLSPDVHPRSLDAGVSLATAAAGLLPGLLSLVSARRSIQGVSSTVDDDLAMMSVAGKLAEAERGGLVVVDRTRLLSTTGPTATAWGALETAVDSLERELAPRRGDDTADPDRLAEGESLLTTCRAASAAMTTVPEGAAGSALALSVEQDLVHSGEVDGILVVKGGAASSSQLVNDRPLMFEDKFSVVATASIGYLLVDLRHGSRVLAGGTASGSAQAHGEIGSRLQIP